MNSKGVEAKILILHLIALLFVVISFANVGGVDFWYIKPLFVVMMVFYFSALTRVFSTWFVFLLGVWEDAILGQVIGITSLCYILLIRFFWVLNEKMFNPKEFVQIFNQFILFCSLFVLMKYLAISAMQSSFLAISPMIIQLIISLLCYILMHKFFEYLYKQISQ